MGEKSAECSCRFLLIKNLPDRHGDRLHTERLDGPHESIRQGEIIKKSTLILFLIVAVFVAVPFF